MNRQNFSSGTKWEEIVGYSRAVRVGNFIEVTGTVAIDDEGNPVSPGDAYAQTRFIFEKIDKVLKSAGGSLKDVIRVRMFVTDISRWEEFGRAHSDFFKHIKPCNTMVEVSRLIAPEYLVEVEASAILSNYTRNSSL